MVLRRILFIFTLLSLCIGVQSASWSIVEIKTNKTSLVEGELFEVSAVIEGHADNLTYTWDFGDGSEKLQLVEPKAYHVFYIDDITYSKEFQVSVVVSDGKTIDVRSIAVKVRRARSGSIKIKPFGSGFFELHSKSEPAVLSFEVLDYSDNILEQSKIKNMNISIKGEALSASQESIGLYKVELIPRFYFNYVEFLNISVEANLGRGYQKFETELPVYFAGAELKIPSNPLLNKKAYIGMSFGEIETKIVYPDNSSVTSGEFYASIISDTNVIEKTELIKKEDSFSAKFEHVFSLEDTEKRFSLVFWGRDKYSNILAEKEYEFTLSKDNPLFNLIVLRPDFLSKNTFGFEQEITIEAQLNSTAEIKGAEVFLAIPSLGIKKYFNKQSGKYVLNFTFPSRKIQNAELHIIATGTVSGNKLADFEIYPISITNALNIDFIYPADIEEAQTIFEKDNMLKVSLSYPDGSLVEIPEIKTFIYLDGERKSIVLKRDLEKGYYFYKFSEPLLGSHTLKLVLTDAFAGTKEIEANIVQPVAWNAIVVFLLILAVLCILIYGTYSRFKQWKSEQLKLSDRLVQLENEMKVLQKSLFKGKVSPEQYKEKMLLLQNEKEAIRGMLSNNLSFSYFISSFIKSLRPKKKSALKQIVVAPLPKLPPKQLAEKPEEEISKERKEVREIKAPKIIEEKKQKEQIEKQQNNKTLETLQRERTEQAEPAKPKEVLQPQHLVQRELLFDFKEPFKKAAPLGKERQPAKPSPKEELVEIKKKILPQKEEQAIIPATQAEAFSPEEIAEINRIYGILKPMSKKYKPGELYRALIAEGYKPAVALAVIEKIFKEKEH